MAHVLLLTLICMVVASGASYIDYGVNMPQYGGSADYDMGRDPPASQPSDDYRGRSPDASTSLDYKYEEPRVKTEKPAKDADELEGWRKPGRKQSKLVRPLKNNASIRNKYDHDDDEIPKFRTNRRYSNHRPRLKTEIDQTEEETPFRRHNKYSRDRKDDISELDRKDYLHIDKDYVPDDKNKEFDDDVKFMREITNTKRPNRRRPRERELKRDDILSDYVDALPETLKSDSDSEKEPPRGDSRRFRPSEDHIAPDRIAPDRIAPDRVAPDRIAPDRKRYRSSNEEEEETRGEAMKPGPGKFKAKGYDEYDDYYDMKRVQNIKNKLPSLPRRTTVRMRSPTTTKLTRNLQALLLTNRRMMDSLLARISTATASASSDSTNVTQTTTSTVPTTTATSTPATSSLTPINESVVEKSKLSIVKKAQRKEGFGYHATEKPPVLLQVSSFIPTVVMVEPPSSTVPWMRSRDVEADSPARIELVKRLMRHKLIAKAKNIHDLTNNWDEVICDYIDVSTLENAAMPLNSTMHLIVFCLYMCAFVFYL